MVRRARLRCTRLRSLLLAVPLAAAAAGFAAAPAQASGVPVAGSLTTTVTGVPAQVPVDGYFLPTFSVRSDSPDRIAVSELLFHLDVPSAGGPSHGGFGAEGVFVLWKDPVDGAWRPSTATDAAGDWQLTERGDALVVPAHGTLTFQVYIAMGQQARRGTQTISSDGIAAYTLLDAHGDAVDATLDRHTLTTSFEYGFAGAPTAGPDAPATPPTNQGTNQSTIQTPAAGAAAGTTQAGATQAGAAQAGPATSLPAAAMSAGTSPFEATAPNSASASPTALPVGIAGNSIPSVTPYAVAAAFLVLVAFAGGMVLNRRLRRSIEGPHPPSHRHRRR